MVNLWKTSRTQRQNHNQLVLMVPEGPGLHRADVLDHLPNSSPVLDPSHLCCWKVLVLVQSPVLGCELSKLVIGPAGSGSPGLQPDFGTPTRTSRFTTRSVGELLSVNEEQHPGLLSWVKVHPAAAAGRAGSGAVRETLLRYSMFASNSVLERSSWFSWSLGPGGSGRFSWAQLGSGGEGPVSVSLRVQEAGEG